MRGIAAIGVVAGAVVVCGCAMRGGVAGRDDAAVRGEIGSVGGAVVVDDGEAERVVVRSLNRARAGVAMVARYMLAFADVEGGVVGSDGHATDGPRSARGAAVKARWDTIDRRRAEARLHERVAGVAASADGLESLLRSYKASRRAAADGAGGAALRAMAARMRESAGALDGEVAGMMAAWEAWKAKYGWL
ncbi:MAG: hypothetical protein KDA16_12930 [Phycisphaerales bacterium]|nr:hypothetical protein [Phycisphaerales bacterium]